MKLKIIAILVQFAFLLFVVHDIIPNPIAHYHSNEIISNESENHNDDSEHNHNNLSFLQIDENYIIKKSNLSSLKILTRLFTLPLLNHFPLIQENVKLNSLIEKKECIPISPLLYSYSYRGPPICIHN